MNSLTNDAHVAALNRRNEVRLDGELIGTVGRIDSHTWTATRADGRVLTERAYTKSGAIGTLVRDRLTIGDRYRITGLASATGGPWTLA